MTNKSFESGSNGPSESEVARNRRLEKIRILRTLHDQASALDRDAQNDALNRGLILRPLYVKKAGIDRGGLETESVLMTPHGEHLVFSTISRQRMSESDSPKAILYFPLDKNEKAIWIDMTERERKIKIMISETMATYYDDGTQSYIDPSSLEDSQGIDGLGSDFDSEASTLLHQYRSVDDATMDQVFQTIMQYHVVHQETNYPVNR